MDFEKKALDFEKIGEKTGFISMFFVFSIILYFLLKLLNKIPDSWNYFHIFFIALVIIMLGTFLRRVLR